ncbi:MAG: fatty acid desaturase [Pseudomonadota bacterium]
MTLYSTIEPASAKPTNPRDWVQILARYREPNSWRSGFELFVSIAPFITLWVLACLALEVSYLLAFVISALNGAFLLRLFCIQHDCGHGSFFSNRHVGDWVGRAIGVLTLTPYDVWRRTHSIHHSGSGNLDLRGIGDVQTLTVREYRALSPFQQLLYRLYRHPLVLFGIGPSYVFLLQNRLPFGLMRSGSRYWISAMGTNLAVVVILGLIGYFGGLGALFLVFLPSTLVAASIGMWLFYVQHQFETTHWDKGEEWQLHDAALHGSSHYDLPVVLRWLSANIGVHHVHHLYARIPFYRLTEVLRDHAELVQASRMTLSQSLQCASLDLWDEQNRRLISFKRARAEYGNV